MLYSRIHMLHNQMVITLFYYPDWGPKEWIPLENTEHLTVYSDHYFYKWSLLSILGDQSFTLIEWISPFWVIFYSLGMNFTNCSLYAAVNGHLELTLLKGRQRFDAVSTSNLEVYKFRDWWIFTYFISGHDESSPNNIQSMVNLERTCVLLLCYFLCFKVNLDLENINQVGESSPNFISAVVNLDPIIWEKWWIDGESWPNDFVEKVNRGEDLRWVGSRCPLTRALMVNFLLFQNTKIVLKFVTVTKSTELKGLVYLKLQWKKYSSVIIPVLRYFDPHLTPAGPYLEGTYRQKCCQSIFWPITTSKSSITHFLQIGTWVLFPLHLLFLHCKKCTCCQTVGNFITKVYILLKSAQLEFKPKDTFAHSTHITIIYY